MHMCVFVTVCLCAAALYTSDLYTNLQAVNCVCVCVCVCVFILTTHLMLLYQAIWKGILSNVSAIEDTTDFFKSGAASMDVVRSVCHQADLLGTSF